MARIPYRQRASSQDAGSRFSLCPQRAPSLATALAHTIRSKPRRSITLWPHRSRQHSEGLSWQRSSHARCFANAAPQWAHLASDRLGPRVRLPTTLSAPQKTLRKQTKSLQRRERAVSANTAIDGAGTISHSVFFGLHRCPEGRVRNCCGPPYLVAIAPRSAHILQSHASCEATWCAYPKLHESISLYRCAARLGVAPRSLLNLAVSTSRARGNILSRQPAARRALRRDLDDIYREQAIVVGDCGLVRVALSRPDQRRIAGRPCCLPEQGRGAELEDEIAQPSSRKMDRIGLSPEKNLAFGRSRPGHGMSGAQPCTALTSLSPPNPPRQISKCVRCALRGVACTRNTWAPFAPWSWNVRPWKRA